ncbi:MAG: copper chaperone PCu(A)C [Pseudomonadota bacterium]
MVRTLITPVLFLLALPSTAHEYAVGGLSIIHPYVIATAPNAPVAGAYMTIVNTGGDDVLLSAEVPDTKAGLVRLHDTSIEDGIMRMIEVEGGIPIPAGQTVTLESGGLHLMLMQLPQGLADGDLVPATLTFQEAGDVQAVFLVQDRDAAVTGHHGHGG